MFGDAFLVAPVLTNAKSRNIYLPEGEWLDLNTGETITVGKEGKEIKDYAAGISVLPVFYNVNSTSETVTPELIEGIQEIFAYAKTVAYGK
jgi:alpha-glucosidase (family GH31 glycosyl hydrolase)